MRINSEPAAGGPVITGLSAAGFRIGDTVLPALTMTTQAAQPWSPPPLDQLSPDDLRHLLDAAPEFILLGTGATLARPPLAFTRALDAAGIGVEIMDSRAAARAWSVLRGEGRVVAAALYPLG